MPRYLRSVAGSLLLLHMLALTTACEGQAEPPPGQAAGSGKTAVERLPAPPPASSPLPDRTLLLGEWILATIDGATPPPDAPPIEVIFTDGAVHAQSQCIGYDWISSVEEGRLRLRTPPGPVAMCARAWSAWEERFGSAMSAAIRIASDGREMIVTGPKGELKLKRPD